MGIGKFFSEAGKLLIMGVGISDSGTIPRKIDLSKIVSPPVVSAQDSAQNPERWRLKNCSASIVEFKGKEAAWLTAPDNDGLAFYDGLELSAGKIDLLLVARTQSVGVVVRAHHERGYEIVSFDFTADSEAGRLTLAVNFDSQRAIVELPARLIDEWVAVRIVLAQTFTAVFLNHSNVPCLKVEAKQPYVSGGGIGLWIGAGSQALVADLKYLQSKKRDFE